MAHIHELIDYTAGVYIVYQNKVLIRKHEKYGIWIHVGGHIELDEHPVEAAIREAKEEVGLDVTIPGYAGLSANQTISTLGSAEPATRLPTPKHMNIHPINETHQHLDLIFYATADTDAVVPENPDDEWVWLTKEEVATHPHLSPLTKEYALGALSELAG
jgi:8-oxo-dGTP pyrophosphatase MutT (NUDIX family)